MHGGVRGLQTFQEVVYSCLAKNPAERPTAQQLLQMRFFKTLAMAPQSLARNLLAGVPLVHHLPHLLIPCPPVPPAQPWKHVIHIFEFDFCFCNPKSLIFVSSFIFVLVHASSTGRLC